MEQTIDQQAPQNPLVENQPPQIVDPSPQNNSAKKIKFFPIFAVVFLFLAISAGAYYVGSNKDILFPQKSQSPNEVPATSSIVSRTQGQTLFTGTIKRLSENLKLFALTEDDKMNGVSENDFIYYSAGVFSRGNLQGYTRIVAIRPALGPGSPTVFTLATKDFKTYILDDPENKTTKYAEDSWDNPYFQIDKNLIAGTQTFDSAFPQTISLDERYSLYAETFATKTVQNDKRYYTELDIDTSNYQKLNSPIAELSFFSEPFSYGDIDIKSLPAKEKQIYNLKMQYFSGKTEIYVLDSTGLPYLYALTTPENIKNYASEKAQYDAAVAKFETKETIEYPDFVFPPNLGFSSSKLTDTNGLNFFKKYATAFPDACANDLNTRTLNLQDTDLESIGMYSNIQVYGLKNKNHPLYTLAFNNKLEYYLESPETWKEVNKNIVQPTLSSYVASNPLLFIKDFWGRWVALGEYDINLPGGCGKPVIYLYPEKETKVSIHFQAPIQFTADIPIYRGSWEVLANPDGKLVDLQQQTNDCRSINTAQKGSEYAQNACLANTYPYLYWAGNVNSVNYPETNSGWIVSKENLSNFVREKLTYVGLNQKEIADFSEYWIPEILSKGTPFYHLSFLQNQDLNTLFPMTITPQPDSIIRVFLDYKPLSTKPTTNPEPQVLNRFVRHGFTLVEWGGKKI